MPENRCRKTDDRDQMTENKVKGLQYQRSKLNSMCRAPCPLRRAPEAVRRKPRAVLIPHPATRNAHPTPRTPHPKPRKI